MLQVSQEETINDHFSSNTTLSPKQACKERQVVKKAAIVQDQTAFMSLQCKAKQLRTEVQLAQDAAQAANGEQTAAKA